MNSLLEQVKEQSKTIATDSYSMSVGELLGMYKEKELILRPEFQRFFRWSDAQKSRLIESVLLGIPLPSIFVSQKDDGRWEVIDGLQRLSTLFETAGELRGEDDTPLPPLCLSKTRYLPEMEGLIWKSEDDNEIPSEIRLRIKRSRLDVNIVLDTSDDTAKYELFQRLNTGGSKAVDQEVRNALLLMNNPEFFEWMEELSENEDFRNCVPMSDRQAEEQFPLELVTRFVVLHDSPAEQLRSIGELGDYLTDAVIGKSSDGMFDKEKVGASFQRTFSWLNESLGQDSFKKYYKDQDKAKGGLLVSIYEVIALGIGYHASNPEYELDCAKLKSVHRELPDRPNFRVASGSGIRGTTRLPQTVELGRQLFE